MATPRKPKSRKPAKPNRAKATDTLTIPGTFNDLNTKSLTTKKLARGWPKAGK
jgi:hypothetical protein